MTAPLLAVLALLQFDSVPKPRPLLAVGEALAINVFVNRVDAWVFNDDWAHTGPKWWRRNIRLGWEWDEDAFPTNMFAHPYHGGLYFNAGRSNGLDYFESVPIAFMGSWTWEYLGETYRPSLNDWFMTSFGGITLGEMFHRLGAKIRDNRATGFTRTIREIASLPVDPIGGFNRLIRGQWTAQGPNPPEHDPTTYALRLGGGIRFARRLSADSGFGSMGTVLLDVFYGDQVAEAYKAPFDVFSLRLLVTPQGINALRGTGRLYATNLNSPSGRNRHMLAVNQRYDFIKNPAQSIGGQSVEIGINSRFLMGNKGFGIRTALFGDGILLGAIDAPGTGFGERHYDFGPGLGARWEVALEKHGQRFLRVFSQLEWIHAVSGASADHVVNFGGIEGGFPITKHLGFAASSTIFGRVSTYSDNRPRDARDYPEARLLITWTKAWFAQGQPAR
ncbi:MAG TPA: DUF3943 domain-containing protein [Gemmatimonadales bacterium]|nr:DUF3943 domain-containing protein [Gemmatimonadales bacterium]